MLVIAQPATGANQPGDILPKIDCANRHARCHTALARRHSRRLSRQLVSTVAASALGLGAAASLPPSALAQTVVPPAANCVVSATTVTCTGDVEAGLVVDTANFSFIDTLIVKNVDAPGIAPGPGIGGIDFQTDLADINIDVDTTGTAGIRTTGNDAVGIFGFTDGSGNIDISNIGHIATDGFDAAGISAVADGFGYIDISNVGDIATVGNGSDGIFAFVIDGGDTNIVNIGDITTRGNGADGIYAETLRDDGDITVRNTGNVTAGGSGLYAKTIRGDVGISHNGDIQTTGDSSFGIFGESGGGDVVISSTGGITSTAGSVVGISGTSIGGELSISSNGDLNLAGAVSSGIAALSGNDLRIVSSGDIDADSGISATSFFGKVEIASNGDITSSAANSTGIFAVASNGGIEIASDGDITTTGASSTGVLAIAPLGGISVSSRGNITSGGSGIEANATFGNVNIENTGNIAANATAIQVFRGTDAAPSATITTSGVLTGGSGFTIDLRQDGNDVVNLLPGSVINGAMDFGNGNDGLGGTNPNDIDTLNFLPGLNATVNFADAGGSGQGDTDLQSAPEIINFAGGGVLINGGLTAVAVDATGFAGQGTQISDVTDAVFNVIDNQGEPSGAGLQNTQAFARGDGKGSGGARLWGASFGGHHHLDGTASLAAFDHNFGGLTTGLETGEAGTTGTFGVFAGYSRSRLSVDFHAGDTDTDTVFGGAYFKRDYGTHRIHAAFAAGATDNDATRAVNGVNATGNYHGYFIAPSLTASVPVDLIGGPMNVSGRATYVYMHLDGYTETGVPLPLTVGARDLSLFNLRAQLNLPHTMRHENGTRTRINWAFGVDATVDAGSDGVNAIVAATPFTIAAEMEDEVLAFLGLNVAHTSANGRRKIGLGGELKSDFDGGVEAAGEVRASLRF